MALSAFELDAASVDRRSNVVNESFVRPARTLLWCEALDLERRILDEDYPMSSVGARILGAGMLLWTLLSAGMATAETPAFQRPAFEDARWRLDMTPAREPGMGASILERGFTLDYTGWHWAEDSPEVNFGIDAAAELKWGFVRVALGVDYDSAREDYPVKPLLDLALGHSFEAIDVGARLQWLFALTGPDDAERLWETFASDPARIALSAFFVARLNAAFSLELVTGIEILDDWDWDDGGREISGGDIFITPRAMWHFTPSLGLAIGTRIVTVGKLYTASFLPRLELVYTRELSEGSYLDVGASLSYGYSHDADSFAEFNYHLVKASLGCAYVF